MILLVPDLDRRRSQASSQTSSTRSGVDRGIDQGPVRICREVALGDREQLVDGHTAKTEQSPILARFRRGAVFRDFDLYHVYVGRPTCHPSDNIAARLAVAEAEGASATELIAAIVLPDQISCRLADAFDSTSRGWDDRPRPAFPPRPWRPAS